jgi:hypothetical protein
MFVCTVVRLADCNICDSREGNNMKRLAAGVIFALSLLTLLVASPAVAAGNAGFGCPTPYEGFTFTQSLDLPRIQAGLDAGAYTEAQLQGTFDVIDHNNDGVICLKVPHGWDNANPAAGKQYFYYLPIDDNSSV